MSGLWWKIPLIVLLAALVAGTALVSSARRQRGSTAAAPAVTLGADGIARAKLAIAKASSTAQVQQAVRRFARDEGRNPLDLAEVARAGYLDSRGQAIDLHRYRYDPVNGTVTTISR